MRDEYVDALVTLAAKRNIPFQTIGNSKDDDCANRFRLRWISSLGHTLQVSLLIPSLEKYKMEDLPMVWVSKLREVDSFFENV